jgi:hypothetical protein
MKHLRLLQLPGKSTAKVVIVEVVAVIADLQAASTKAANADAPAKSIFLDAAEIVESVQNSRFAIYQVIQQRHRHDLKRLYLSVVLVEPVSKVAA